MSKNSRKEDIVGVEVDGITGNKGKRNRDVRVTLSSFTKMGWAINTIVKKEKRKSYRGDITRLSLYRIKLN